MGIVERREREKEEMRKLILDTSLNLFVKMGFENVSMRTIAEAIEYSVGTLYLYFKDKDEIFFSLFKQGFEMFYQRQQQLQSIENSLERMKQHAKEYIQFAFENPALYEIMFVLKSPMKHVENEHDIQVSGASFQALVSSVQQCMDDGFIAKSDLYATSLYFWGCVHGIVTLIQSKRMFCEEGNEIANSLAAVETMFLQLK
jgi:AcrR family transcriptional regulator